MAPPAHLKVMDRNGPSVSDPPDPAPGDPQDDASGDTTDAAADGARADGMTADDTADAAIAAVFTEHRLGLLRLAVLLLGDRASAEDVVQDAFAGLHRRRGELRETSKALPYARAAVVNGCRMVLRRRSLLRRIGVPHEPPVWSAESAAMIGEDRREVMRALQRLPRRRREVLVLRYYLDQTDAEIAVIMGIGQATVRSTAARALASLGDLLREDA
jgi:RNA polymerase sigma-70 factor (sigma-E family)